ncbi:MAG: DNA polymerase III subunit delta [Ignavibacteria bacterium]|nr:DNA polymerase III subunit delta [Ignavibacteria bacterium]
MTYSEFQTVVRSKRFAPVYLFYGEEDFLIDECIRAVIENTIDPEARAFDLDVIDGSKAAARDVVAHALSFPMTGPRRVVVVKEFEKFATTETEKEILAAYIERPLESTCLVAVSLEPDFRRKPFTDLKKRSALVECRPLYDNQVPGWISERIRRFGKEANAEACRLIHAYVGNSLRSLQNEIDKLFIFVGDRQQITADDVTTIVGASKGYTIFELQNAIGRKDTKQAMRIIERMTEVGQSPQMIIVMLTRFFNQIWKLSDVRVRRFAESDIIREIGIPPYYVRQYMEFHANFTMEQIERNFMSLLDADIALKTTSRAPRLVMDLLVLSLIQPSGEATRLSS